MGLLDHEDRLEKILIGLVNDLSDIVRSNERNTLWTEVKRSMRRARMAYAKLVEERKWDVEITRALDAHQALKHAFHSISEQNIDFELESNDS